MSSNTSFACEFCQRMFTTHRGRARHLASCKARRESPPHHPTTISVLTDSITKLTEVFLLSERNRQQERLAEEERRKQERLAEEERRKQERLAEEERREREWLDFKARVDYKFERDYKLMDMYCKAEAKKCDMIRLQMENERQAHVKFYNEFYQQNTIMNNRYRCLSTCPAFHSAYELIPYGNNGMRLFQTSAVKNVIEDLLFDPHDLSPSKDLVPLDPVMEEVKGAFTTYVTAISEPCSIYGYHGMQAPDYRRDANKAFDALEPDFRDDFLSIATWDSTLHQIQKILNISDQAVSDEIRLYTNKEVYSPFYGNSPSANKSLRETYFPTVVPPDEAVSTKNITTEEPLNRPSEPSYEGTVDPSISCDAIERVEQKLADDPAYGEHLQEGYDLDPATVVGKGTQSVSAIKWGKQTERFLLEILKKHAERLIHYSSLSRIARSQYTKFTSGITFLLARKHILGDQLFHFGIYHPDSLRHMIHDQYWKMRNITMNPEARLVRYDRVTKEIRIKKMDQLKVQNWSGTCTNCKKVIPYGTLEMGHLSPSLNNTFGSAGLHNIIPLCHECNYHMGSTHASLYANACSLDNHRQKSLTNKRTLSHSRSPSPQQHKKRR